MISVGFLPSIALAFPCFVVTARKAFPTTTTGSAFLRFWTIIERSRYEPGIPGMFASASAVDIFFRSARRSPAVGERLQKIGNRELSFGMYGRRKDRLPAIYGPSDGDPTAHSIIMSLSEGRALWVFCTRKAR